MSEFSDEDMERLAKAIAPHLVEEVQKGHHEFWIDKEQHYLDHKEWQKTQRAWEGVSKIFWTAFIGLVVIGAVVLAAVGIVSSSDLVSLKKTVGMVVK